ncbi:MAG: CNNM domain-containing protein [Acidobacteriota bacterium]
MSPTSLPAEAVTNQGFELTLLVAYILFAVVTSFVCSILEAAFLSVREGELEDREARGDAGAGKLLNLKRERVDDAISAILILNTLAHTLGVAGAGLQAGKVWPNEPFLLSVVFPAALTLVILVGTEIIPKTLGAVYASKIVGPVASLLSMMVWTMGPLLAITRLITGALTSHEKAPISRGELAAMVSTASREGTLHARESRVLANVLRYHEIQLRDVMTPRTVAAMVAADADLSAFLANPDIRAYSRIPLFDCTRDHVVGYVLQREVLGAAANGADRSKPVADFKREALFLPQDEALDVALRRMTQAQAHLALAVDTYGGISGLVTLEDLLETILGVEIVDESDRVVDLRKEAAALREKRLRQRGVPPEPTE